MSRQYREFKVGDLFELRGLRAIDKTKLIFKEEGVEFVGRTNINNGVQGYIGEQDFEPYKGGTISVSQVGTIVAQYRENHYYCSQNIVSLSYSRKLNRLESLYITTLINKALRDSGFEGYTTPKQKDIKKLNIKLPITPQGGPDWQYMEDFMKEIESETQQTIETIDKISNLSRGRGLTHGPYSFSNFKVGDLFTIERGNITNQGKLKDYERGVSFVAQNVRDNGYVKRIKQEEYKVFEGNSIIVGRQTGVVHYQEDEFVTTDGVLVLKGDIIKNKNMGLYLTTMLKSNMRGFGYTNPVTATKLKDIEIEIPIDKTGAIDWEYMEDFMRNIEQESEEVINKLQTKV